MTKPEWPVTWNPPEDVEQMEAAIQAALAAATGTAKTAKPVECEASQSGPKGNAPEQSA